MWLTRRKEVSIKFHWLVIGLQQENSEMITWGNALMVILGSIKSSNELTRDLENRLEAPKLI